MAELAALNVKITGDATDLKAAVNTATGDLTRLGASAQNAGVKIQSIAPKFGAGASAGGGFANSMRGVSQQLSQVGQQTMATGNFAQALAIQLPDIGVAFGTVGAAAGLLAGIALPLLINAFGGTSEKALAAAAAIERLKDAQTDLANATIAAQTEIDKLRFGVDEQYQVELLREQIRLRDEYNLKAAELNGYLATTTDSLDLQRIKTEQQRGDLERIAAAYKANADSLNRQADRAAQLAIIEGVQAQRAGEVAAKQQDTEAAVARTKTTMGGLVSEINHGVEAMTALTANAPKGGWLNGAIADAQRLATALWDSASAQAANHVSDSKLAGAYGLYGFTREQGPASKAAQDAAAAAKGGGGGSATNPIQSELDAVQNGLMTQEQLQLESFARQQETLQAALAQRLITQQEYAAMMEAAQQQHSDTMAGIDVYRYGTGLQQAGAFLGGLADVFASGNDRLLRISRIAGAAQGMIDAWGAYLKALNAPGGLTPMGRLAAALPVLAAGLKAVSAIKGGGSGGGGAGVATAAAGATTSTSSSPLQVMLNTYGAGDMIRGADLGALLDRLGQEAGDRGYRLMWAPS